MAQTSSYEIANDSGAVVRGRLNEVFSAIQSSNAGATAPTNTAPGMLWLDTSVSPGVLKRRNSANTDWLSVDEKVPDPQDDTDTDAYLWAVGDVQGAVIVESDSNANGKFTRFSNGVQICTFEYNNARTSSDVVVTRTVTFPAAFINTNYVPLNNQSTQRPDIQTNAAVAVSTRTTSSCEFSDFRTTSTDCDFDCVVIGYWK